MEGGACGYSHVHVHEGRLTHQGTMCSREAVDRRRDGSNILLAKTAIPIPWPYLPQEALVKSPTSYTTNHRRSRSVASSLDHGFCVPEDTFSPTSSSAPQLTSSRGRRRSQIPPSYPRPVYWSHSVNQHRPSSPPRDFSASPALTSIQPYPFPPPS